MARQESKRRFLPGSGKNRDTDARTAREARDRESHGAHNDGGAPARGVDRARQREEYGGFNFGAAFFGWLVAIGITVLLTALLSAAGAAIGITSLNANQAEQSADTLSLIGGILLIVVLALGYYAGGYVAGRMSRFDGARQGLGVWLIGLAVTILLAVIGAIAGSQYNVLGQLNLPRIPIDEGSLTTGALIALLVVLVVTAVAALLGGKLGERYHRKIDRVGEHR
ncbi:hypothetical protein HJD18_03985 [Thermoleophilia bacterium SCSIO 60948]|nr:hypothetical protein HJD18_03985 [Thermoleophilia bacterium SCSIO 60948]